MCERGSGSGRGEGRGYLGGEVGRGPGQLGRVFPRKWARGWACGGEVGTGWGERPRGARAAPGGGRDRIARSPARSVGQPRGRCSWQGGGRREGGGSDKGPAAGGAGRAERLRQRRRWGCSACRASYPAGRRRWGWGTGQVGCVGTRVGVGTLGLVCAGRGNRRVTNAPEQVGYGSASGGHRGI